MATRMQQRRGTASQWISTNSGNGPILAAGEIGFESDTNKFKVGDGVNHWVDLTYFTDAESITTALNSIIDGAPDALNTLNELAAAIGDDANFLASLATEEYVDTAVSNSTFDPSSAAGGGLDWNATTEQFDVSDHIASTSYVDTAIDAHALESISVHGIPDTGELATKTYSDDAVSTHSSDTTGVHGIDDTSALATKTYADSAVSTHSADTTSVHGIADTAELATKTYADNAAANAVSTHSSDTTSVHGIADTAELATKTYADDAGSSAASSAISTHSSDTTDVHGIADTSALATTSATASAISTAVSDHNSDTTNVHGISDTADLATKTYADTAVSTHSSDTTSVHGIADTSALALTATVATDISTAVSTHSSDTTSVHGITDTADLLLKSGGTMTGALTLSADPSSSLHAATKQYVDNTASGVVAKPQVLGATTTNIDATYNNGTLGVGATLTHNTNGAFPAEAGGATGWAVGSGILVKNQTNKAHNGRYFVSNMGSASTPYVLTRCGYCDEASEIPGAYIFVQGGTNAGTGWIQVVADPATFVVGTDNIDVFQFSGSGTITAGTNISVSGNEVSVVATPSLSGVTFSDGTQTKEGVASRTPIIQKTAGYTLSTLTHRDSLIEMGSASEITLSIPTDATLNYPIGTSIDVIQTSTGQVTIAAVTPGTTTVNGTPGLKLRGQWSSCTLFKRAANTWIVMGDLSA
jgi:hypothetical protein